MGDNTEVNDKDGVADTIAAVFLITIVVAAVVFWLSGQ
jgi:hypothetical protein